jgi:predicted dehydrogenase
MAHDVSTEVDSTGRRLGMATESEIPRVVLVGAGNIGRRYLEGLASVRASVCVHVVDPNSSSLDNARQLLSHSGSRGGIVDSAFHSSLAQLSGLVAIAIVATTADVRPMVVQELSESCSVEFMILEKLVATNSEGLKRLRQLPLGSRHTWVNYPRRLMRLYRSVRQALAGAEVRAVRVMGHDWALASNSSHFIDLTSWISGEAPVSIDTGGLTGWKESHRPGYHEVSGILHVRFGHIVDLSLVSVPFEGNTAGSAGIVVEVDTSVGTFVVMEASGELRGPDGGLICRIPLEYQSQLTGPLVDRILETGSSGLTDFSADERTYQLLLDALNSHFGRTGYRQIGALCIT